MSKMTINIDAMLGEPAIVIIGGTEYKVQDPPMEKFLRADEILYELAQAKGADDISACIAKYAAMIGLPPDALQGLSIRQFGYLTSQFKTYFLNSTKEKAKAASEGPLAESPQSPSPLTGPSSSEGS